MIGGDIPMQLTAPDVRRLWRDGFSFSEIAYMGGMTEVAVERLFHVKRASRCDRSYRRADQRFAHPRGRHGSNRLLLELQA